MALPIGYNFRNIKERWKTSALAIGGIALVVTVFVTLLSMATGFRTALRSTGRVDNAIVVQQGSISELTSWFSREHANKIMADSRIARSADGRPLASCEVVVINSVPRRTDGLPTNVTLRAVTPIAFDVRGGIKIVEGRKFQPGLYEIIVGQRIRERVRGLDLGSTMKFQNTNWKVVGIFAAEGGSFESEAWADYTAFEPVVRRGGGCESLTVRMAAASQISGFDKDLRGDPQLRVQAQNERQYYEDQAGPVALSLTGLAVFVAVVMGLGAVFGAMNTMYAIVSQRTREVGTLRALGFSRRAILFSFVVESTLLSLIGGAIGCALAIPANGITTSTGQTTSFSEIAFAFKITPQGLLVGILFAAVMGVVGGLLPAIRAARLPITSALREA
jgi:putative ABC transport system permease protein